MDNNSYIVRNAPVKGMMQKSNKDSFFLRMHINSSLIENILNKNAKYDGKKVVILQVMMAHKNWFLVELVEADKL